MEISFFSHPIRQNTPTYGNRDKFVFEINSDISEGDSANSSRWYFTTNHMSTHIDMPKHFFESGKDLNGYVAANWVFNNVQLLNIPCKEARIISKDEIEGKIDPFTELLLIKTGYEQFRSLDKYWNDNPGISPEIAEYIRVNFPLLRCIGFDFISLTSWKFRELGKAAHKKFLDPHAEGNPIWVIEDMSLEKATMKVVSLTVLPLFVENADASPVSIIAEVE